MEYDVKFNDKKLNFENKAKAIALKCEENSK